MQKKAAYDRARASSYCIYSFFNVARYAIPVARDAIPVARYAIGVSREGGNLHLGGTVILHIHCRAFDIFISHDPLPSDFVAQSVGQWWSNPKVVGSIPTLVRVFLCPNVLAQSHQ